MSEVLITGASGLIGQTIARLLLDRGDYVTAAARDKAKAEKLFGPRENLRIVTGDVTDIVYPDIRFDYIIHAAGPTSSGYFISNPVETIRALAEGTMRILEFARTRSTLKRFIYLSSMEVYGAPETDKKISESHPTNIDTMKVRSCYPEGKRMCENICASYASEYGVPVNVLRLTQTFGPGITGNDGRVFAEFARCAIEGRDIVLKTKGDTRRSYLHTEDTARAVLTVMEKAPEGEVYNAANEDTYCSILEMAEMVAENFGQGRVNVRIEEDAEGTGKYAPTLRMNLDSSKLRALGWEPRANLKDMYSDMIEYMKKVLY